jgi:hypothetical protein
MAITKTTKVRSANIHFPATSQNRYDAFIQAVLVHTWEDPEDASFPITNTQKINIERGRDISSFPNFVQELADWVWRD